MAGTPANGTWSRVSRAAALDLSVPAEAVRVLCVLGCYADASGRCYPSVQTIADHLGLKRRQAQRHLRALEKAGYLRTDPQMRVIRGGFGLNNYVLLFPATSAAGIAAGDDGEGEREGSAGEPRLGSGDGPTRNERDASSDDTSVIADASSDDTSQKFPRLAETASAQLSRSAMRHPTTSDASPEGLCDASSHDALTNPEKTNPPPPSPASRGRALEGGDLVMEEVGAWQRQESAFRVAGGGVILRFAHDEGPDVHAAINEYVTGLSDEDRCALAIELGSYRTSGSALLAEIRRPNR